MHFCIQLILKDFAAHIFHFFIISQSPPLNTFVHIQNLKFAIAYSSQHDKADKLYMEFIREFSQSIFQFKNSNRFLLSLGLRGWNLSSSFCWQWWLMCKEVAWNVKCNWSGLFYMSVLKKCLMIGYYFTFKLNFISRFMCYIDSRWFLGVLKGGFRKFNVPSVF